jgi:hypothetical protein
VSGLAPSGLNSEAVRHTPQPDRWMRAKLSFNGEFRLPKPGDVLECTSPASLGCRRTKRDRLLWRKAAGITGKDSRASHHPSDPRRRP